MRHLLLAVCAPFLVPGSLDFEAVSTDAARSLRVTIGSAGDLEWPANSECVDAGPPAGRFDDLDGTRNDVGAYGGPHGAWYPLGL